LIQYKEDITMGNTYGADTKRISTSRRHENIEGGNEAGTRIPLTKSTDSLDIDDGGPRARGYVDESGDHHAVKLHSPLSKAPLVVKPVVERKQLSNISEPLRERRLLTYITIGLEICDMPLDALSDFLE
jgi:hypothetical protein